MVKLFSDRDIADLTRRATLAWRYSIIHADYALKYVSFAYARGINMFFYIIRRVLALTEKKYILMCGERLMRSLRTLFIFGRL